MQDARRPLREHLEELRRRLLYSLLALAVGTGVAFVFWKPILQALLRPAEAGLQATGGKPVFTEATEFLAVTFKVSLLAGLALSLPFILYQMAMFVAPGLTPSERRYLLVLLPASLLAFAGGGAFAYLVLLPVGLPFLLRLGEGVAVQMVRISSLVNLVLTLIFWMGLIFNTPIILYFLARVGVVEASALARARRYVLVGAFLLGAIITPTFDPVNQTLVALPLYLLYEVGVVLARLAGRSRRRALARALQEAEGSP